MVEDAKNVDKEIHSLLMYWLRPFQIFDVGSWTKDKDKYEIHFLLISPPAESLPLSSYWDKDEGKDQMKFTSNCWKVVFDFERKTKTRKRQKFTSPLCMASPPSWSSPPSSYWAEQQRRWQRRGKWGNTNFTSSWCMASSLSWSSPSSGSSPLPSFSSSTLLPEHFHVLNSN